MTATPSVTREQAALIAQLLRTIRPAWDEMRTAEYVGKASVEHRDFADLLHGCIRTAQDQTLTSPASLTFSGEHWTRSVRAVESPEERRARIQAQLDAREERAREYDPKQRARAAEIRAQIRADLAAAEEARKTAPKETAK